MADEGSGDGGGGGGEGVARCARCHLEYNRDERCPRILVCGHTCCTTCLDDLISKGQKRCPTCNRYFFSLSVVLIPKNLQVLNGERSSVGSSQERSGYGSPLRSTLSLDSNSSEVTKSSKRSLVESSQERSGYGSPLRSTLSLDSSSSEVTKSSERSRSSGELSRSGYGSPLRSSLSLDSNSSGVTKSSERSSLSSYSEDRSSSRSSYSSARSSLSYDSALSSRSSFPSSYSSAFRSSAVSSLGSSSSLASFHDAQDGEGGEGGEGNTASSFSVLSPPPVPSSAPPSLQESYGDLSTSEVRSRGSTGPLEGDGGGQDASSGAATRPSILKRSSSAGQASGGSYTPPTYSFPTIRTKLNIEGSRAEDKDAGAAKPELRPAKSLPPPASSSSSSSSWSLPPLSSSLGKEEGGSSSSSGYASPFLKSSSSFSSSSRPLASLASGSQPPATRGAAPTDSVKEAKNTTPSSSSSSLYSSLPPSSLDSTDGSSLSRSLPSLHKLDAKLRVAPPARPQDEVDLGVSRWKMDTSTLLSRRTPAKDAAAARRTEGHDAAAAPPAARASGTPSHVLRMIRSVTAKPPPAAEAADAASQADEARTSLSSHGEAAAAASLTTSKNTATRREADHLKQGAAAPQVSQSSETPEAPPAGTAAPPGVSDWQGGSVGPPPAPGPDGGAEDASEGRGGTTVSGSEAWRQSSAAAPPTGSRGEESQPSRKLALSASLRARLGARTRFLATAIDEASEEELVGGGESSAGEPRVGTGREDKLYTPERRQGEQQQQQQQQQQAGRPRVSLGARISARAGYLSGGWGGGGAEASRGEVQAEDPTKIDLQRRAGRAETKNEATAGGHDGQAGQGHGEAGAHLAAAGVAAAAGVEGTPRPAGQGHSLRTSGDAAEAEGGGAPPGAPSSGHEDPRTLRGSVAPTQEPSQRAGWRRHRAIDSWAKEEQPGPGRVPRAAADHGPASASTGPPEVPAGGAPTPDAPSTSNSAVGEAAPAPPGQRGAASHHRGTKLNDTSEEPTAVFRSEAGSVNNTPEAAEGGPGAGVGRDGGDAGTPPPLPPSGPYPWRKKWRSVTEHTSSAAARHSPSPANNTALSGGTSRQPERPPPPRSPPPPGEAPAGTGGGETLVKASYRAPLGALAIGRVPSVQETDGGGGGGGGTRQRPATEDTTEDINARLRRARERLRATTTTPTEEPTEEPAPSPARTNLAYLLTRVQGSEAASRTARMTTLSDEDEEVFVDSEGEADGGPRAEEPQTPPAAPTDGGLTAGSPERSSPSTGPSQERGHDLEDTTDEVDSVTRRRHQQDRSEAYPSSGQGTGPQELHDEEPRRHELSGEATEQVTLTDAKRKQFLEQTRDAGREEQGGAAGTDEDTPDAPYEAPAEDYGAGDSGDREYEPGVGLCSSHGQMLDLYCQDCGEWVCRGCLRVLHRPRPGGSCQVIPAAEGVKQMKVTHSSFLTSRSNTLEYFKEELRRIIDECSGSIHFHRANIRQLEADVEEERRLLRGIKAMRTLAKEKKRQVDYWEEVLKDNLARVDESSTSQDVIRAVQESSGDILRKAMEAVSLEAGGGVLLSPPTY